MHNKPFPLMLGVALGTWTCLVSVLLFTIFAPFIVLALMIVTSCWPQASLRCVGIGVLAAVCGAIVYGATGFSLELLTR